MSEQQTSLRTRLQWFVIAPITAAMVVSLARVLAAPAPTGGELAMGGVGLLLWTAFAGWLTWPDPSVTQEFDDEAATLVLRGSDGAFARIPYENFKDCRVVRHLSNSTNNKGRSRSAISYSVTLLKPDAGAFELPKSYQSLGQAEEAASRCQERMAAAIAAREKSGKAKAKRDLKLSRAVTTDKQGDEIRWSWSLSPSLAGWIFLFGLPTALIALARSLAWAMTRERLESIGSRVTPEALAESPTWLMILTGVLLLYCLAVFVRFVSRLGARAELRLGEQELVFSMSHLVMSPAPIRLDFEEIDTVLADNTSLRIFRKGELSAADVQERHGTAPDSIGDAITDIYTMMSASIEIESGRLTTVDRHILDELISARVARSTGRRSREV